MRTTLEEIMDRLAVAQMEVSQSFDKKNRIQRYRNILEVEHTDADNAFIRIQKDPQGYQINHVTISTGLINNLLKKSTSETEASELLAGIFAHEYVHPIEVRDPAGIGSRWGEWRSSQAIEIRSDTQAIELLKKAHLPANSLLRALEFILPEISTDNHSVDQAALSTLQSHPEFRFRKFIQRLALSYDRYENGEEEIIPLKTTLSKSENFPSVTKESTDTTFKEFSSIAETLNFIESLKGKKTTNFIRSSDHLSEQLTHAVLSLNEKLMTVEPTSLSHSEVERIAKLNLNLGLQKNYPHLDLNINEHSAIGKLHKNTFLELIEKVPLYQDPRYQSRVIPQLKQQWRKAKMSYEISEQVQASRMVLPQKNLVKEFEAEFLKMIHELDFPTYPISKLDIEYQLPLYDLFMKERWPKLSDEKRFNFFVDADNFSFPVPTKGMSDDFYDSHLYAKPMPNQYYVDLETKVQSWHDKVFSVKTPEASLARHSIAKHFWDKRGHYATWEILQGKTSQFDWDFVFKELGIEKSEGLRKIASSVKEFTESSDYLKFIEYQRKLYPDDSSGKSLKNRTRIEWMSSELLPWIKGEHNAHITDPKLRNYCQKSSAVLRTYLRNPEIFREEYLNKLTSQLNLLGPDVDANDFGRAHNTTMLNIVGANWPDFWGERSLEEKFAVNLVLVTDLYGLAVDQSSMSEASKKRLLKKLYLDQLPDSVLTNEFKIKGRTQRPWPVYSETEHRLEHPKLTQTLIRHGLVDSFSHLLSIKSPILYPDDTKSKTSELTLHLKLLERHREFLEKELSSIQELHPQKQASALNAFCERVYSPLKELTISRDFYDDLRQKTLDVLKKSDALPKEKIKIFNHLSSGGGFAASDRYWEFELFPLLKNESMSNLEPLIDCLKHNGIRDSALRLKASTWITEKFIAKNSLSKLAQALDTFDLMMPGGSSQKDETLEKIAWNLSLSRPKDLKIIEEHKSTNWRRINPLTINKASAMSQYIHDFTREEIMEWMSYISKDPPGELPESIKNFLRKRANDAEKNSWVGRTLRGKSDFIDHPDEALFQKIESLVNNLSAQEKIPLLELCLHSGVSPLNADPQMRSLVMKHFLKIEPSSKEGQYLEAFLDSIPSHEVGSTLAFKMSQQAKSGLKESFQVFKAPGIKAGQGAATFDLLGAENSPALQDLKDNARPMDKAEIIELLRKELTPIEKMQIGELVEILGSASLKTVVLAKSRIGGELVIAVQNPRAESQVRTHLKYAKRFLENLEKRGLIEQSKLVKSFVVALERQLKEELKMKHEAQKISQASSVFTRVNHTMKAELDGWKLNVPQLKLGFKARDNILFMKKANGMTFDKLSPDLKEHIGPILVRANLRGLLSYGWIDADRHIRNQLIDVDTKTLHLIDFGQGEKLVTGHFWQNDDRTHLIDLLASIQEKNSKLLVETAVKMSKTSNIKDRDSLIQKISPIFQEQDFKKLSLTLLETLAENGIVLEDRFSVGAIKGLLTLYSEPYVSHEVFKKILAEEALIAAKARLPSRMISSIKQNGFSKTCKEAFSLIRGQRR
jgi:predicted unusual protein kinase regulating ubiquinone biosynthesis (AarF/ABC1/UbiB family)